jgi:GT2 family glycosyltransferase
MQRTPETVSAEKTVQRTVAVILVNWNGREVTLDCLRSLHMVKGPPLHILVVDNASSDGSVEAIRREYPEVELLCQERNLRFAGGNNVGIRRALDLGAPHLLLLNNDTTIDPFAIQALVDRMERDERCGMVAPKIYYADRPATLWFAGGKISFWSGTMKHLGIREEDRGQHDQARRIDYATGCCMLVRTSIVRSVGGLDESYYMYGEDADWSMRVWRAGYTVWYEPLGKVWHKLSVSAGGHLSSFKLRNKLISSLRFFARYARWYHWLTWPWMLFAGNAVAAVRYKVAVSRMR